MSYLVGISGVERWDWDESIMRGRDGVWGRRRKEGERARWRERGPDT